MGNRSHCLRYNLAMRRSLISSPLLTCVHNPVVLQLVSPSTRPRGLSHPTAPGPCYAQVPLT